MAEEERERQGGVTEPVTPVEPGPKWSGAAPVPPPGPKRKRWLEDETRFPPPPPPPAQPRDPTLDLPTGRRFGDDDTPVDPWADVDPLPSYPMDVAYPPTRQEPAVPPPAPASPPSPPPLPAPVTKRKERTAKRPEPAGPPPGWRPPPGYVAVPVRRRRRWPWFALLSLLCCCGCPAWFGEPFYSQFPADAAVPTTVAGLTLRDDPQSQRAANELKAEVSKSYWFVGGSPFAGLFVDGDGKRTTVFGTTGLHVSPDSDVTNEIGRVTPTYNLRDVRTMADTERGESRRCGVGTDKGTEVVVCSWADHGSLGTGVFTRLDVDDSNALLSQLRDTIVTRKADG
ncbi:hypothetical protein [Asanoa siamensis]|uniref:Uncharacterized protein n=1 Tax=Asanoa siamensis TaxID=926357 RepID=A0ABQ4CLM6_9ACTN|nr:hypothetical protein [Asanoa siamensis]GIF72196.1 hypothetical protein Asi02nite_17140 [Asanoa siamensis]